MGNNPVGEIMSIYSNPASSTPSEIATYVAALIDLLGNNDPVAVLAQTPAALERFLANVPAQVVTAPEAPGKWSIRGVVQHLADSELVGGSRLRMVMSHERPHLTGYVRTSGRSACGMRKPTSGRRSINSRRSDAPTSGSGSAWALRI